VRFWSIGFFVFAQACLAQQLASNGYRDLPLSALVDLPAFQTHLQSFVDKTYLSAFRELGGEDDFDHAHLLYTHEGIGDDKKLRLFAILYHTQEHADKSGNYVDRYKRNWIQFLGLEGWDANTSEIYNAFYFMYDYVVPTERNISSLQLTKTHYTVHSELLDYEKFPSRFRYPIAGERMIVFSKAQSVDCDADFAISLGSSGIVHLRLSANAKFLADAPQPRTGRTFKNESVPQEFQMGEF
jgi:hypothetical protein